MSDTKKKIHGLILNALLAVIVGGTVVAEVLLFVSSRGGQEPVPQLTVQKMNFPENEQSLSSLASQLDHESKSFAGTSPEALSNIAPAAGDKTK